MMQHHNYSLGEIESLIPWERDVYLAQLIEYIETENEKIQLAQIEQKRSNRNSGNPFG